MSKNPSSQVPKFWTMTKKVFFGVFFLVVTSAEDRGCCLVFSVVCGNVPISFLIWTLVSIRVGSTSHIFFVNELRLCEIISMHLWRRMPMSCTNSVEFFFFFDILASASILVLLLPSILPCSSTHMRVIVIWFGISSRGFRHSWKVLQLCTHSVRI